MPIPIDQYFYHGVVLSNYHPDKKYHFKNKISQLVQTKYDTKSVFLKYHFNIPKETNRFSDYIKYIDEEFGNVDNCQFSVQKKEANGQKIVVLTWKNINRLRNQMSSLYN